MKKRVFALMLVGLFALDAAAFPPIPEAYRGIVYLNGSPAPKGTKVKVVSDSGMEYMTSVVDNTGLYALDVLFDDVETANVKEGASVGEALTWYVGGLKASQPAPGSDVANSGGVNVNFNVLAGSSGSSCSDGVRNNGEEGVDCGGPCPSCGKGKTPTTTVKSTSTIKGTSTLPAGVSTTLQQGSNTETAPAGSGAKSSSGSEVKPLPASCSDGVRNSGEEGVDCGGPCKPCGGSSNTLMWVGLGVVALLVFGVVVLAAVFVFLKSRNKGG